MGGEILFGWADLGEGVDERAVGHTSADAGVEVLTVAVGAVAGGPIFVEGFENIRLAVFEGRLAVDVERRDRDGLLLGEFGDARVVPTDAEDVLKKGIAAVHDSAL